MFQLESRGMKDLIRRLKPDRFEDIVALVALFRPGPLQSGMVDDFIARKHATSGAAIDYLHPSLKPVLEATYGVILYQEQVMQIAQVLSGYTLGGADLLRRAMGKKKAEEMAKQRAVFVDGAVARGVEATQAAWIFDLIEKFAGYGFNKSHSAAYALLVVPDRLAEDALSGRVHGGGAVVRHGQHRQGGHAASTSAQRMGLDDPAAGRQRLAAISFTVAGDRAIRYGLGADPRRGRTGRSRRWWTSASAHGPYPQPRGAVPAHRSLAREPARARSADHGPAAAGRSAPIAPR